MTTFTNEFKDNLAAITGNGTLIKLDVVDPNVEERRLGLVREYGYDKDRFDAALFIYICNVLDDHGLANKYPMGRKVIIATTAKSVVDWFNSAKLLVNTGYSLSMYIASRVGPTWLDEGKCPSSETIELIEKDMDRVFNVWHDRMFDF